MGKFTAALGLSRTMFEGNRQPNLQMASFPKFIAHCANCSHRKYMVLHWVPLRFGFGLNIRRRFFFIFSDIMTLFFYELLETQHKTYKRVPWWKANWLVQSFSWACHLGPISSFIKSESSGGSPLTHFLFQLGTRRSSHRVQVSPVCTATSQRNQLSTCLLRGSCNICGSRTSGN